MKLASFSVDHELKTNAGTFPVHICLRNKQPPHLIALGRKSQYYSVCK